MKNKIELLQATLMIPVVLNLLLSGLKFDRQNLLSVISFSIPILIGYLLAKKPIGNKYLQLMLTLIISLAFGGAMAALSSRPMNGQFRVVGQILFTFIGLYWIGAGIFKREQHNNVCK